LSLWFQISCNY